MTTKLLAASLLLTTVPSVVQANEGASKDGWVQCVYYASGVTKYRVCKVR
jgi:hypothetical protein